MIHLSDRYNHRSNGADPFALACYALCVAVVERAQADADGRLPGVSAAKRSDVQAEASAWLAWLRGC